MNGESYVVRIYKRSAAATARGRRRAVNLVGIVENTLNGERSSFHDMEELWAILARPARLSQTGHARLRNTSKTRT